MGETALRLTLLLGLVGLASSSLLRAETPNDAPQIDDAVESHCRSIQALIPRTTQLLGGAAGLTFSLLVGDRGLVLRGNPQTTSWERIQAATSAMLTSAAISDKAVALIVGHEQTILRSTDSGRTWDLVHQAPRLDAPLFDVTFVSSERAFAVGAYGTVLSSSDEGLTWEPISLSDDEDRHAYALVKGPQESWFMTGEAGLLYQWSADDSEWQEMVGAPSSSIFDAILCNDQSMLAVGLSGRLYRSSASLDSWSSVPNSIGSSLFTVVSHPSGVLLGGMSGVVASGPSCDGPFEVAHTPARLAISAILPLESGTTLLLGESGVSCIRSGHQ